MAITSNLGVILLIVTSFPPTHTSFTQFSVRFDITCTVFTNLKTLPGGGGGGGGGRGGGGGGVGRRDSGRSIFRSARTPRGKGRGNSFFGDESADLEVMPSVRRIREFIEYVFNKAQLEIDGLIIAFIYLERLLAKASRDGVHLLYSKNWRTLCFISLVLASKIWDDFSMDNADFAVGKWLVCAVATRNTVV